MPSFLSIFPFLDHVILYGGMQGVCSEVGAVHLYRRKPLQGFRDIAVSDLQSLFDSLAPGKLGCHRRRRNRGNASEGLEPDVAYPFLATGLLDLDEDPRLRK